MASVTSQRSIIQNLPSETTDFISDQSLQWVRFGLGFIMQFILLPVAMTTTIITMNVFVMIGIKGGISVAFFALSAAQFGYLLFYFTSRVIVAFNYMYDQPMYVDLASLGYIVGFYYNMFEDVADVIVVFIAVQKCCCVAIPFHFRNSFTYSRSVITVTAIYLCAFLYYMPVFTGQGLSLSFNILTNSTELSYTCAPLILIHASISRVLNGIIMPVLCLVIIIVCLIILTVKLTQASRFRKSGTNVATRQQTNFLHARYVLDSFNVDKQRQTNAEQINNVLSKEEAPMNRKELKVIRSIYFTAIVFAASNVVDIPLKFTGFVVTSFQGISGLKHYNTFVTVSFIQSLLAHTAVTLHVFIYAKFNTKFKTHLLSMLRKQSH